MYNSRLFSLYYSCVPYLVHHGCCGSHWYIWRCHGQASFCLQVLCYVSRSRPMPWYLGKPTWPWIAQRALSIVSFKGEHTMRAHSVRFAKGLSRKMACTRCKCHVRPTVLSNLNLYQAFAGLRFASFCLRRTPSSCRVGFERELDLAALSYHLRWLWLGLALFSLVADEIEVS